MCNFFTDCILLFFVFYSLACSFEGEDLAAATKRLRQAQKHNIMRLAEMGAGEVQVTPEYETVVQLALNKYSNVNQIDMDKYLAPRELEALPLAAGAEDLSNKTEPSASDKPKRVLKNPLDATWEDY
jgi:hypothetical protein